MRDTPDHIRKKQIEIILSKPMNERLRMTLDMIDFARETTHRLIKRQHPEFTDLEVKVELFRRTYKNDFTPEEMDRIVTWMKREERRLP